MLTGDSLPTPSALSSVRIQMFISTKTISVNTNTSQFDRNEIENNIFTRYLYLYYHLGNGFVCKEIYWGNVLNT